MAIDAPPVEAGSDKLSRHFLSLGELLSGDLRDAQLIAERINRLHALRAALSYVLEV